MSWKDAFFRQAENDYAFYREFKKRKYEVPLCQRLHYFQMAIEKLSKAYLTSFDGKPPEKKHKKFVDFLRASRNHPKIWRQILGFQDHTRYVLTVEGILSLANQIDNLVPTSSNTPNTEYPWEVNGIVHSPLDYKFPEILDLKNRSHFLKIEKIAEKLVKRGGF